MNLFSSSVMGICTLASIAAYGSDFPTNPGAVWQTHCLIFFLSLGQRISLDVFCCEKCSITIPRVPCACHPALAGGHPQPRQAAPATGLQPSRPPMHTGRHACMHCQRTCAHPRARSASHQHDRPFSARSRLSLSPWSNYLTKLLNVFC